MIKLTMQIIKDEKIDFYTVKCHADFKAGNPCEIINQARTTTSYSDALEIAEDFIYELQTRKRRDSK